MSRTNSPQRRAAEMQTPEFDFEAAERSLEAARSQDVRTPDTELAKFGSTLPREDRSTLDEKMLLSQVGEISTRASARFGLSLAYYHGNPVDSNNASIWHQLSRALDERALDPLYAEPLSKSQLEKLQLIHQQTKDLVEIDSTIKEKIDFLLECYKHSAFQDQSEQGALKRVFEQNSRFKDGKLAYLAPNEMDLVNQHWSKKGDLEAGWTRKHDQEVFALLREEQLKLGKSGLVWVDHRGFWEPKMKNGRYQNSTLLELIEGKYLEHISDQKYMPRTAQGQRDRQFIIDRATELRGVLKPKPDRDGNLPELSVESEAIAIDKFLKALYTRFPPPAK